MKKTYINPQIEVIQLKANQTLLAGSFQETQDGYTGDFLGDYNGDTDEKI